MAVYEKMKMPSLSPGTLSAPSIPGVSASTPSGSLPSYAPSLSPGTLRAPTLDFGPSTPAEKKPSFFVRNVPGLNRPVWQIMLASLGTVAIGVGIYATVSAARSR